LVFKRTFPLLIIVLVIFLIIIILFVLDHKLLIGGVWSAVVLILLIFTNFNTKLQLFLKLRVMISILWKLVVRKLIWKLIRKIICYLLVESLFVHLLLLNLIKRNSLIQNSLLIKTPNVHMFLIMQFIYNFIFLK
jgi:hypothetical protein